MQNNISRFRRFLCLFILLPFGAGSAFGQPVSTEVAAVVQEASEPAGAEEESPQSMLRIDWMEEMRKGGSVMIVLALLSVFGVAVALERLVSLRRANVAPRAIRGAVGRFVDSRKTTDLQVASRGRTPLARAVSFVLEHRHDPYDRVSAAVSDLAGRDMRGHLSRTQLLAAVAGLAPLLGLLGTMIGMIESFKLVSIYGDEGGAAILADSISKALVTTAAGLIVAIPALAAYYWFRHRIHVLAGELERPLESLMQAVFLRGEAAAENEL